MFGSKYLINTTSIFSFYIIIKLWYDLNSKIIIPKLY